MDAKQILTTYKPQRVIDALQREMYKRNFERYARDELKLTPKLSNQLGLVPFRLNSAQQHMNRIAETQLKEEGWIRMCLLKARQPGGSSWTAGRGTHLITLTPHTHGMIFAHDDPTSEHILNMVRRFHDHMSPTYRPRIYQRPSGGLIFCDLSSSERKLGSSIYCQTARTALSGTGHTLHFVQLSECSKYPYPDTLWTNLSPAIPDMPGTIVVMESTAYFSGEWFRERCERAKKDPDFAYRFLFTGWYLTPEYRMALRPGEKLVYTLEEKQRIKKYGLTPEQIKWYRNKLKDLGGDDLAEQKIKQDYPEDDEEAWIDFSASVFATQKLYGYLRDGVRPPFKTCDIYPGPRLLDNPDDGRFHIWDLPESGEIYDIGVDVASGQVGSEYDWSVMEVVNRRTRQQVAEWRGQGIDPIDLANLVYHIGKLYNWAQVAVETSGIGFSTNVALHDLNYPNVYIWRTRGEAVPALTKHTGWRTGAGLGNEAKQYMVSVTRHHVVNEECHIRSNQLWNEMKGFTTHVTDSGLLGYAAGPGYHDDTVMAYMIALVIGDDERLTYMDDEEQEQRKRIPDYIDPALVDTFDFDVAGAPADGLISMANSLAGMEY